MIEVLKKYIYYLSRQDKLNPISPFNKFGKWHTFIITNSSINILYTERSASYDHFWIYFIINDRVNNHKSHKQSCLVKDSDFTKWLRNNNLNTILNEV